MTRATKRPADKEPQRKKGTGSITQIPSGQFRPRLTIRGKQVTFAPTLYPTLEDAEAAITQYLAETDETREKRAQGDRLLGEEVARHINRRVRDGVAESTASDLRDLAKNLICAEGWGIGHRTLAELAADNSELAEEWMGLLKGLPSAEAPGGEPTGNANASNVPSGPSRPQGASRRVKALNLARAAVRDAVKRQWIARDPFENVTAVPHGEIARSLKKDKFFFKPQELVAMCISAPSEKERLMIEVHFWAGLRPGEVRAMDGITVMKKKPKLHVEYTLGEKGSARGKQGPVKNRKPRYVTIPEPLWRRLLAWSEGQDARPGEPLFPSATGEWWLYSVWWRHSWLPTLLAAADEHPALEGDPTTHVMGRRVPPTPYAMRATYVSMLQAAGVPQREVQNQVGHATGSMVTDIYSMTGEGVVKWRLARKVGAKGWGLRKTLTALYEAVWDKHGPVGGREALALDTQQQAPTGTTTLAA